MSEILRDIPMLLPRLDDDGGSCWWSPSATAGYASGGCCRSAGKDGGRGLVGLGGGLVCAPDRPWIRGLRARPGRQVSEHLDSARPPEPKLGLLIHCYFDRERLFDNTRQLDDLLSMFARQGMIEKKCKEIQL